MQWIAPADMSFESAYTVAMLLKSRFPVSTVYLGECAADTIAVNRLPDAMSPDELLTFQEITASAYESVPRLVDVLDAKMHPTKAGAL